MNTTQISILFYFFNFHHYFLSRVNFNKYDDTDRERWKGKTWNAALIQHYVGFMLIHSRSNKLDWIQPKYQFYFIFFNFPHYFLSRVNFDKYDDTNKERWKGKTWNGTLLQHYVRFMLIHSRSNKLGWIQPKYHFKKKNSHYFIFRVNFDKYDDTDRERWKGKTWNTTLIQHYHAGFMLICSRSNKLGWIQPKYHFFF